MANDNESDKQEQYRQEDMMADQNPNEKPHIDPKTGAPSKGMASSSATARGPLSDTGSLPEDNQAQNETTDTVNTGDRHAQANLGGRSPAEGRPAMGDQDSTQARSDMTLVDPVTARSPDKLDKLQQKSDTKGGLATRDP